MRGVWSTHASSILAPCSLLLLSSCVLCVRACMNASCLFVFSTDPTPPPGLQLTHSLDDLFGLPRKHVMSQRDVPGMTQVATTAVRPKYPCLFLLPYVLFLCAALPYRPTHSNDSLPRAFSLSVCPLSLLLSFIPCLPSFRQHRSPPPPHPLWLVSFSFLAFLFPVPLLPCFRDM
jgi:hypothetical protein